MVLQSAVPGIELRQFNVRPLGWNIMESLEHHGILKFHMNFQDVLFALNTKDNQRAAPQVRFLGGFKPLSFLTITSTFGFMIQSDKKMVETTNESLIIVFVGWCEANNCFPNRSRFPDLWILHDRKDDVKLEFYS